MKRRFIIVIVLVLVFIISGCKNDESVSKDNNTSVDYIPVVTQKVKSENVSNDITLSGTITPNKTIVIMPKIMGVVKDIKVKVGDVVKKDSLLFTLNKDEISKNVSLGKSALDKANENYVLIRERYNSYTEMINKISELYKKGRISKEKYEEVLSQNPIEQLKVAENAVNQSKAAYSQILEAINNSYITSPIDGVIASININEDGFALNTQPSMTMIDINNLKIKISVNENLLKFLYEGKKVVVNIPSANVNLNTKISTISPAPDLRSGLYLVNIDAENLNNKIKAGMSCNVVIEEYIKNNALVVKSEAIVENGNEKFVFIVENDIATKRVVKTGIETGDYTEIISGIDINDNIVVMGQNYINDNSKIKVVRGN